LGPSWPYRGGLANYNERLARAFIKVGYQVTIYTFTLQYPSFLFPGKTQYSSEPAPEGLLIYRKVNAINPANWIKIGKEIKKLHPDLLIFKYWLPFMGPCFGSIARIVHKNRFTRIISILDNLIPHEHRPGDYLFSKYFIKAMDGLVAQSASVLQDIDRFDKYKPRVLSPHPMFDHYGNAISKTEACRQLGLDPAVKYLLFFGFIRRYKGLDLLLNAFKNCRFQKHQVHLIIAGEYYESRDAYSEWLDDPVLKLKIHEFNEFIPDSKVFLYFSAANALAQTYRSATQSGVAQIAYHFNLPMIVTNVGGLPEIVKDNVVGLVSNPDSLKIAENLEKYFKENLEAQYRSNMKEEKKRFSWNTMVNHILEIVTSNKQK